MLTLERNWWALLLRGLAAIAFGVLAFARPLESLMALVLTYGLYAIADGVFGLVSAVNAGRRGQRWGALVVGGVLSLAAGAAVLIWPQISWLVLLSVIATWAIVRGVVEIGAAIQVRKHVRNEWLLGLNGLLSILFGGLLFARPFAGALTLVWVIGGFAIASGIALVGFAVRLRALSHRGAIDLGGRATA